MLAKNLQAAAGNAAEEAPDITELFSTYLYTGNGSTQTITNGIDLAGEGGMTWIKIRSSADSHVINDTVRGAGYRINSASDAAQAAFSTAYLSAFNSNGFDVGSDGAVNGSSSTYASWTFRKAPKFFDVVTYTGNGATSRTVAHNLASVPGCIIAKKTSAAEDWRVYHRSFGASYQAILNNANAFYLNTDAWGGVEPTSTQFTVSLDNNANGATYVAYLFAHNAGGFGLTGTDNVISCGSFTPDSSGNVDVNLGYEPQWILFKRSAVAGSWSIADTMRGMSYSDFNRLYANLSNAEDAQPAAYCVPTATGFKSVTTGVFSANEPHIYIAIRRGPMRVPESGTSVYNAITYTGDGTANRTVSTTIQPDLLIQMNPSGNDHDTIDRLRGVTRTLYTNLTYADDYNTNVNKMLSSMTNTGFVTGSDGSNYWNASGQSKGAWAFRRAPGFMDVCCFTGTGASQTLNHNLGVAPEMIIVKRRNGGGSESWVVQHSGLTGGIGQGANSDYIVYLNSTNAEYDSEGTFNFSPTSTTFSLLNNSNSQVNASGGTYVAYLFATCEGVSKVGSYTGTGASDQVINCGFTGGARFVMIKRTDGTSNWRVWDTARGIASGNDPSLDLNNTSAEETGFDQVDPDSSGFKVKANDFWNTSGANFIFLAIA